MQINIKKITESLALHLSEDAVLNVIDESYMHHGHLGHNPEIGVTHVAIHLIWRAFEGVKTIERQRLMNFWLSELFNGGLHAVSYTLRTPEEAGLL